MYLDLPQMDNPIIGYIELVGYTVDLLTYVIYAPVTLEKGTED